MWRPALRFLPAELKNGYLERTFSVLFEGRFVVADQKMHLAV